MSVIAVDVCFLPSSKVWIDIHPWQFDGPWKVCLITCQNSCLYLRPFLQSISSLDLGDAVKLSLWTSYIFHTVKILHPYVAMSPRVNDPILDHMDL
jgi:hypothetical protein